jgi:hypothetical protein
VDGTLVPTRDHRLAAQSMNYRYSTDLQVAIHANTRLVIALGEPQPGNRNDTIVYRSSGIDQQLVRREAMADGGFRGNPKVIMPYRKSRDGSELPAWNWTTTPAIARSGLVSSMPWPDSGRTSLARLSPHHMEPRPSPHHLYHFGIGGIDVMVFTIGPVLADDF